MLQKINDYLTQNNFSIKYLRKHIIFYLNIQNYDKKQNNTTNDKEINFKCRQIRATLVC